MPTDVQRVPTQRASRKRRLTGLGVGLGVLAVVAVPVGLAAFGAMIGFSGCFLTCSEPEPLIGAFWAGVALYLLAVPVVAGLVTARVLTAPGWRIALALTAVLMGVLLAPRILPDMGWGLFGWI
jgi:hypothetical protein